MNADARLSRAEAMDLLQTFPDEPPPPRRAEGGRRLTVTSGQDFIARQFVDPPWLVENIVPAGGCSIIGALPKSTKSWLALDLALAVADGGEFLGKPVEQSGNVLLLDAETPPQQLQERIRQLAAGRMVGADTLNRLRIVDRTRIDLGSADDLAEIHGIIAEHDPVLIVLDPLREFHQRDENSASEMSPLLGALREWTHAGAALAIVHHGVKSDTTGRRRGAGLRGSSAIWGWYDSAVFVRRDEQDIEVAFESRYCIDQPVLNVRLEIDTARIVPTARIKVLGLPAFRAVKATEALDMLQRHPEGMRQGDIARALRASGVATRAICEELQAQGYATRQTVGRAAVWTASKPHRDSTGLDGTPAVCRDSAASRTVPRSPEQPENGHNTHTGQGVVYGTE